MTDPWLSYFGHPVLPAGYNSWDIDGDDVNGAGVNWPLWPPLFDTFEGLTVLFVTDQMMQLFDTTCPDYIAAAANVTMVLAKENDVVVIRGPWSEIVHMSQSDTFTVPPEDQIYEIRRKA